MSKQVITLSDRAADRVKEIIASAKEPIIGVRVGVASGGCAGMSYVMEYAKKTNPNDEVIEVTTIAIHASVHANPNAGIAIFDVKERHLGGHCATVRTGTTARGQTHDLAGTVVPQTDGSDNTGHAVRIPQIDDRFNRGLADVVHR